MIDGLISADVAEVVMGLEDELKRRNDQIVGSLLERMERDGYGGIWNINPRFDVESEAVFTMSTASADEPDWGDEPLPDDGPYESASMNARLARAKAWLAGRIARAVGEGE